MAAVLVISLLACVLRITVEATVSYKVSVAPANNMHNIPTHPDKAAITVSQSGDNYAFSVVNHGPGSKVVQEQKVVNRGVVAAPVQASHHVVAHVPTRTFVGAYGAPVFHQPLVAAHQPVPVVHHSPTLVHQVVEGGIPVFRAVPLAHQVVVEPVVHHAVPIPYLAAAHHAQLVPAGHVIPTAHVVRAGHVPHSVPSLLLAHHKK